MSVGTLFDASSSCPRFLKRDVFGIGDPSLLNIEVGVFGQKVEDALPSEARYACLYWMSHLPLVDHNDDAVMTPWCRP